MNLLRASPAQPHFASGGGPAAPGMPAPLREVLAELRAGLTRGERVLALTGPSGTGKTTVGRRLLEQLDGERCELGGMFGSPVDGDAFDSRIVQDFSTRPSRPGNAFLTLEQFLRRRRDGARAGVLAVDDAHALDSTAWRRIVQITAPSGRAPWQVVLIGERMPEAAAELARDGAMPPIGTRCRLRPLVVAETHEFALQRLRSAGWTGPPVSRAALDAVHERSGGVLRRIALLCDRAPMWLAMEGVRELGPDAVVAIDTQLRNELRGARPAEPFAAARTELQPEPPPALYADPAARWETPPSMVPLAAQAPGSASARRRSMHLAAAVLMVLIAGTAGWPALRWVREPAHDPGPRASAGAALDAAAPARRGEAPAVAVPPVPQEQPAAAAAPASSACAEVAAALGLCAVTVPTPPPPTAAAREPAEGAAETPTGPACPPQRSALGLCAAY